METRVTRLEDGFSELTNAVRAISSKMDKVGESITALATQVQANKPLSYNVVVTTTISTFVLASMVAGLIFFLVDARVGSATVRSNAFVEQMTEGGHLYVRLSGIDDRIKRLEGAIQWRATLTSDNTTMARTAGR